MLDGKCGEDWLSDVEKPAYLDVLQQQTVLAKFGELALTSDDLDEILTRACQLIAEALGTDLAKVMELQEDGETLLVRAGVGWKPGVVGEVTIKATDNTSEGVALLTGEPMISPDIAKETRFSYPAFLTDNGVKAIANVVIIGSKNRLPFGILQIDSREPRQFTDNDTAFLRSYANLLAGAVERLRAIEEVRSGEMRLRLALEAGALGSWDFDLVSGSAQRSARHDEIFGYSEPLPAWNLGVFMDHVLPEDRERVAGAFHRTLDTGVELHYECRIRRADDDEVRWIEVRGRSDTSRPPGRPISGSFLAHGRPPSPVRLPLSPKGRRCEGGRGNAPPTHILGIVTDITERKHAEKALLRSNEALEASVAEHTDELTEANARLEAEAEERERVEQALRQSQKMEAVGQLTGGLAHDFNNLLAGISGSLELMRIRVGQGRGAEVSHYIDVAMGSANRAAALIQRLLAFSRRQTLDPKPTNVNRLVGGMAELFRRTVGPGIRVETRLAGEPWPALCDPNQLESALLNLVINARDAMPDGGHLLIETANSVLPVRRNAGWERPCRNVPPGEYMALSVVDDGAGMNPDVIARAFDPFFTTKPMGEGTGLGLSMIYGFVQQSGGHVRLCSKLGQGTTVTIYLPRHLGPVEDEAPADAVAHLPAAAASAVVLVVEDEPDVRMVIVDVLSDIGYTTIEAADGRSGLQILESGARVDLLLTDVGLSGAMNGRQLADTVRHRRPGLKALFVTGYAESVAVGNGRMEQGMQVLTKPFAVDALATRVRGIISG